MISAIPQHESVIGMHMSPPTSLVAQWVKRLPTMRETQVRSLGREDPLEKEMATHSYSCLENPMDCSLPSFSVHGVAKSRTRLSDFPFPSLPFTSLIRQMILKLTFHYKKGPCLMLTSVNLFSRPLFFHW